VSIVAGRAGSAVRSQQLAQDVGADQRHVGREHDRDAVAVDQIRRGGDRVGGPERLGLDRQLEPAPGAIAPGIERARQPVVGTDHDDDPSLRGRPRGLERPGEERAPAQLVRELRRGRSHPRPATGGEDDNRV
jgi:hypothetical protein